MKAAVYTSYGGVEKITVRDDVLVPTVAEDEVLISVEAAGINPSDVAILGGYGKHLFEMFGRKNPGSLGNAKTGDYVIGGAECAGIVESVGCKVSKYNVGDRVYTSPSKENQPGCWAEKVSVKEAEVAFAPKRLSLTKAAALPYAASTMFTSFRKAGILERSIAGKRCFVHGASGAVGSLTVQVLSAWGAEVYGSCSAKKISSVKALGAVAAVDYRSEFAELGDSSFAFVLNGEPIYSSKGEKSPGAFRRSENRLLPLVAPGGQYATLAHPVLYNIQKDGIFMGALRSFLLSRNSMLLNKLKYSVLHNVGYHWVFAQPCGSDLELLSILVDKEAVQVGDISTLPLDRIVDAIKLVTENVSEGKVIVKM